MVPLLAALATVAMAGPDTEPTAAGQAIADALRDSARSDISFMAAGLMKAGNADDLASNVQYPADDVVVVKVTGKQIKSALERSSSLYPSPNPGFLQLSGIEATFSKSAASDSRVSNVTINGSPLDLSRTYTVAMPGSLGRGGLGYFTVWDKSAIERVVAGITLESVLKGKATTRTAPRWKIVD